MYHLVQVVFDHLQERGAWPLYRELEVALWRDTPIQEAIRRTPPEHMRVEWGNEPRIALTLEGLRACETAGEVLEQVVVFARMLGERHQASGGREATVESSEVAEEFGLSEHQLCILREVLDVVKSGGLSSGSSHQRDSCHFSYRAGDKAYLFQSIETIDDYVAAIERADQLRGLEQNRQQFSWLSPRRALGRRPVSGPQDLDAAGWTLHPAVVRAAGHLFNSSAFGEAVRAAFQAFESFVQKVSGFEDVGAKLMGRALNENGGGIPMNALDRRLGKGAHEGLRLLAIGAMKGIRNPHSHGPPVEITMNEAVEQLGFASFLFRRLEEASGVEAFVEEQES